MLKILTPRAAVRTSLWTVLPLAAVLLTACSDRKPDPQAGKGAPPEVGVVIVSAQDAPLSLELPGRLSASQVAEIRPQVSGIVLKRLFTEGSVVRAGQPLYQLDAASYEAERARTAAALQKAEAQAGVARTRAERDAELLKADALSRQSADDSASALRQAQADVAVARAALDAARVQLDRTRITAPITGRIEVSTVTAGALVTANQTQVLTTVQQLDPMHVDIVQSSAEMLQLRRQLDGGTGSRQIRLLLEDGSEHPQAGMLQVSGVTVDRGTGAVTLRATVPNPAGALLPGMVVRARLLAGVDSDAILVPQQGVSRSPTGDATALVVGEGNKAETRRLVLKRALGNQWLVASGLKVGDKLIVEGLQRVRANQVVTPVPAGAAKGKKAGAGAAGAGNPAASATTTDASASAPASAAPTSGTGGSR
ncbi:efflux RND transporter periplasmic adaptor subunit [Roseateles amylovorans]|uniref:Efflux RND transporter periplasmic adaptor subunit n=1 Tax=Roseateles amylovorans TaxID=2978473 RepID=A0ABY6AUH8_9BURK|nr:efflux RND transporter periplasmic adaptor subunit [Roseateles amylovorans]UXH76874.1 efflux RND transporter periplasmic adaptor subunit [Roseateles amylovorans]